MEEKTFYVALVLTTQAPIIVENFNNSDDAELYATILARNKKQDYIVLTPCYYASDI